jgi:hypothetical protein
MDNELLDDSTSRYPAAENTPGQGTSRAAYARFMAMDWSGVAWLDEWKALRAEGWDWRKAAYIAWKASPNLNRWPATQEDLAVKILGLRSDRVIRTWIAREPGIEERIARLQIEPLMRHRRDVINALVSTAALPDPRAHQDRKLFLEMTRDYKGSQQVEVTVPDDARERLARLLGANIAAGDQTGSAGAVKQ